MEDNNEITTRKDGPMEVHEKPLCPFTIAVKWATQPNDEEFNQARKFVQEFFDSVQSSDDMPHCIQYITINRV